MGSSSDDEVTSAIGAHHDSCCGKPSCFFAPAQSAQMKDDVEQLAVDLHAGMDRSTLTKKQKAQLRENFKELRQARQNH
jgi:hypothetical protein